LEESYTHDGEEAGYIISGQLELQIDDMKFVLEAGDSFSFPSQVPHRYRNPGNIETGVIWAMTPPTY
jgi:quercetin dioxygenase-like cupin family protein